MSWHIFYILFAIYKICHVFLNITRQQINKPVDATDDYQSGEATSPRQTDQRKDTNKKVLTQLQTIFGHLLQGRVQFHIPKGLWRDFRYLICNSRNINYFFYYCEGYGENQ